MKAIGYISTTVILIIYGVLMNGWALSNLWAWFIVPTFSLPELSIPEAIGVALVVNYFTQKWNEESEEKYWKTLLRGAIISTVKPLIALGLGAIVKLWL